jgi:LPXTG-motif cell wall-anchored protein
MMRAALGGMAAFALALGGATTASAAAPETTTITGKVTSAADGSPVAAATVFVNSEDFSQNGYGVVQADGTYRVDGLPAGSYTVRFDLSGTGYVSEYWDGAINRQAAQRVNAVGGETIAGIDATLELGGSITGVVTRESDGSPVVGATVLAASGSGQGSTASQATDAEGRYKITGLAAGAYTVEFSLFGSAFATEYWQGATDAIAATPVQVSSGGEVSGIDASLVGTGTVNGHVSLAADGSRVPGFVHFVDSGSGVTKASAYIDTNGNYTASVAAGTYIVRFTPSGGRAVAEYWEDALVEAEATPITVSTGQTISGVDAALDTATAITGTVRVLGELSGDALIEVYRDGVYVSMVYTKDDGSFEAVVPAGTYTLLAKANVYEQIYAPQYFDGVATAAEAAPVTLTADADRVGVDFDLSLGGDLQGTVTADGAGGYTIVTALLQGDDGWNEVTFVGTEGDFSFAGHLEPGTVGGSLPAGTYTLRFEKEGYCTQYFGGAASLDDAKTIELAAGEVLTGVDATMTVTCPDAQPQISLSSGAVQAGNEISVSGTGFAPGQKVAFELRSDPIALGTLTADAGGVLRGSFTIPASAPAGAHTLVALSGSTVIASAALQVNAAAVAGGTGSGSGSGSSSGSSGGTAGALANTGSDAPVVAATAALLLLFAGLVVIRRRRVQG